MVSKTFKKHVDNCIEQLIKKGTIKRNPKNYNEVRLTKKGLKKVASKPLKTNLLTDLHNIDHPCYTVSVSVEDSGSGIIAVKITDNMQSRFIGSVILMPLFEVAKKYNMELVLNKDEFLLIPNESAH